MSKRATNKKKIVCLFFLILVFVKQLKSAAERERVSFDLSLVKRVEEKKLFGRYYYINHCRNTGDEAL